MADTKPYVGGMTSWGNVAQLQEAAERRNAQPEVAECGHQLDQPGMWSCVERPARPTGRSTTVPRWSTSIPSTSRPR